MCFEAEKKGFERFLMSQYEFWIHILHIYLRIKTKSVLYTLQRMEIFMQKKKRKDHKRALHVHRYRDNSNLMEEKLFSCAQIREDEQ